MAQHTPIEFFEQKAVKKIAEFRKEHHFKGSLKYEELPREYQENPFDRVFVRKSGIPKSIMWFNPAVEIHTRPKAHNSRELIATNIYVVG